MSMAYFDEGPTEVLLASKIRTIYKRQQVDRLITDLNPHFPDKVDHNIDPDSLKFLTLDFQYRYHQQYTNIEKFFAISTRISTGALKVQRLQ